MANRKGEVQSVAEFIFLGSKIIVDDDNTMKLKESYDKSRQVIKKQRYHFVDKDP